MPLLTLKQDKNWEVKFFKMFKIYKFKTLQQFLTDFCYYFSNNSMCQYIYKMKDNRENKNVVKHYEDFIITGNTVYKYKYK